jgi:hypothetical protein
LLLLLAAGKHVQVYMDLDKTGAHIMSYRDIENEMEAAAKQLEHDLGCTRDERVQARLRQDYQTQQKLNSLYLGLTDTNWAHHDSPEAADPGVLETRLNATVRQRLSPEEVAKYGMVFTVR